MEEDKNAKRLRLHDIIQVSHPNPPSPAPQPPTPTAVSLMRSSFSSSPALFVSSPLPSILFWELGLVLPSACTVAVAGLVRRIRATTTHPLAHLLGFFEEGRCNKGEGEKHTIGKPSVTPPTVFRRGEVTPPTMGRPLVVSSTVFRSL
jgi:hypothetical protein